MSRFNTNKNQPAKVNQPIVSTPSVTARTGNNAPGFVRDAKGELFLLAVSNFVGQDKFYESGKAGDNRFKALVQQVAQEDAAWMGRFLPWLRNEANMRTASIVGAIHAARMMLVTKRPGGRQLLASVLQRADEPGEALAFYMQEYGRNIPKPIKRGIADAATRLYNEFNTLKYDTASHGIRFGDVLELTHARPYPSKIEGEAGYAPRQWQVALFKHLIDRRHGRDLEGDTTLHMIFNNSEMRRVAAANPKVLLNSESLKAAGMTWEDALSLAGSKVPKDKLWEAMIPNMGYMALLRNLRNFDEAGVSNAVAQAVASRLIDPDQVARSKQFPFRFLSAFRATASNLRWGHALEQALNLSLSNVPEFSGRTLVLVDQSPSMFPGYYFSTKNTSDISLADQAKIFGTALAMRSDGADLICYGDTSEIVKFSKAESMLKILERFRQIGGTNTGAALSRWYARHDRVVIVTDEQTSYGLGQALAAIPNHVPVITFNVAGYQVGHAASGTPTRITIGGLSDQAFKLLPVLERRAAGQWPF